MPFMMSYGVIAYREPIMENQSVLYGINGEWRMGYGDHHLWHKGERAAEIQQEAQTWLAEKEPVMADKSVLDNIPVNDTVFPLSSDKTPCTFTPPLVVVSKCPHCGNPIYGKASLNCGEDSEVKRTCSCISEPTK